VRKTETIRKELGSLAQVLEDRLATTLRTGIRHDEADKMVAEIEGQQLDPEKRAAAEEELEAAREQKKLGEQIDLLRNRINDASKWIGLDMDQLRDTLSCSLELLGAEPLKQAPTPANTPTRYEFPNLDTRHGADPSWSATLDTLRAPQDEDQRLYQWRKESPIRPVVFNPSEGIDDDTVQLHLQHRVVQRLLGRFLAQGFVHHDLSRACLAHTSDAIPRVVLLGRLSLYGTGAVRLHEEILTVTARWTEPPTRRGTLAPTPARRKPRPSNCSKAPCTPAHNPKSPKLSPPACKHPSRVTSKNSFTPERKGRRAVVGKGEGHQRKCGVRRAACGMRLRFCQVAMPAGSQTLTSRLPACLR
jgi:hypothetical protein